MFFLNNKLNYKRTHSRFFGESDTRDVRTQTCLVSPHLFEIPPPGTSIHYHSEIGFAHNKLPGDLESPNLL